MGVGWGWGAWVETIRASMILLLTGNRCSLKYTRQIIDAIHDGTLDTVEWEKMPGFGLEYPKGQIKDSFGIFCSGSLKHPKIL